MALEVIGLIRDLDPIVIGEPDTIVGPRQVLGHGEDNRPPPV